MKNIFSCNADINKTAYMNWRTDKHDYIKNIITVADGFMESSLISAKEFVNDNYGKRADVVIFPILFNANHAIELYLKSAEQGYAVAQYNLGLCYEFGEGVEQDFVKSAEWYEKSAEQGHAVAQYHLAYYYEMGKGVKKDISKAYELYKKSADNE